MPVHRLDSIMKIDATGVIVAGLATSLNQGANAGSCPSGTVSMSLSSASDVPQLVDALGCTGEGKFNVSWHGRLLTEERIEVSDNKRVSITGYNGTIQGEAGDHSAVVVGEEKTGLFLVTAGSTLTMSNLVLQKGYSETGGAVDVHSSSSLHVFGCHFKNNRGSEGGAIYANRSDIYIDGTTTFSSNSADFGGAVFVTDSRMNIDGSARFAYNTAKRHGGAVYGYNSTIDVNGNGKFTNNSAAEHGGALYTFGSKIDMKKGFQFANNSAFSGGGIFSSNGMGSELVIGRETTFAGNVAEGDGGAMSIGYLDQVYIDNVTFASNTADQGGAIYVADSSNGILREYGNCTFYDNSAENGGAIYFSGGDDHGSDHVYSSTFDGNYASTSGGGIYLLKGGLEVAWSRFKDNRAGDEGMAIASVSFLTPVNLSGVTFRGNGLYCPLGQYGSFEYVDESSAFLTVCEGCSAVDNEVPNIVGVYQDTPVCKELPTGTVPQSGGTTLESITLAEGYYRASESSEKLLECHRFEACAGGSDPRNYCAAGYQDVYCATCSDGYSAGPDFSCRLCSEGDKRAATAMVSAVALAFFLAAAVILRHLARVVEDERQTPSQGIFRQMCFCFQHVLMKALPLPAIKIVVVVWQIVFQFAAIAEDVYPEEYQQFLSLLSFANFDIIYIASYSCLFFPDFYGRLLLSTISPLMVLAILAVAYYVAIGNYNRSTQHLLQTSRNRHLSAALFVVFFVYSSVSSTIFQTFVCEDVGGISHFKANYSIECGSEWHDRYKAYAGLMIVVYPIGIPALFCWWLIRNRETLNAADRHTIAYLEPFNSIWGTYRPSRYYYEVMEYGRRLTLSMSSVFLVPNSVNQIAVVLSLVALFMFVSETLSPFESSVDMSLYRWGNIIVLASMYIALLMKANESDGELEAQSLFGWVLIAANVMLVLAVLGQALLFSPDWGDESTTVAQIVPPVRRPSSVCSEGARAGQTTPTLEMVTL